MKPPLRLPRVSQKTLQPIRHSTRPAQAVVATHELQVDHLIILRAQNVS